MSTPSVLSAPPSPTVVPTDVVWRLDVEQYHAMIDAGILTEDDPVELLDGILVPKMPKSPSHRLATGLVREALEPLVPGGWHVDSQEPVTTAESEPEPDVLVVRGSRRDYADRHPGPKDLAMIVEVSDATLHRDQTLKERLYAQAGIPVYWIVNLQDRRIEVLEAPSGPDESPGYRKRREYKAKDTIPVVVGKAELGRLAVADLLP